MAHPRDVIAWHGVSGACMVLMFVAVVPGWVTGAGVALFAAGLLWCGVRLVRQGNRSAYLRLGVCLVAMVVMLAGPQHASGHPGGSMSGSMPGSMAMPGPSTVAVAVAVALAAVALVAVRRPGRSSRDRVAGGCEAALAVAMAAMLLT